MTLQYRLADEHLAVAIRERWDQGVRYSRGDGIVDSSIELFEGIRETLDMPARIICIRLHARRQECGVAGQNFVSTIAVPNGECLRFLAFPFQGRIATGNLKVNAILASCCNLRNGEATSCPTGESQ